MSNRVTELASKENPLTYNYVKMLRQFMLLLGMWPGEALGEHMPFMKYVRWSIQFQVFMTAVGHAIYIHKHFETTEFFMKGFCFWFLFMFIQTFVKVTLLTHKPFMEIVKTFFESFHMCHSKHLSEDHEKVFNRIQKITLYFTIYMITATFFAFIFFTLFPVYLNYKKGVYDSNAVNVSYKCSLCVSIPGVIDTKEYSAYSSIGSMYLSFLCANITTNVDLMLCLMAFQIIGHTRILNNSLASLAKPRQNDNAFVFNGKRIPLVEMFDVAENKVVHEKLVQCMDHHRMIVAFVDNVSESFGPVLCSYYVFHLLVCCLSLFECTRGDTETLLRFLPLTIYIFGNLISLSIIFEIIGTESEKLKDSVYGTPWEHMDSRNRRTVYILLHRVQTPINITAMQLTIIGVTTMVKILKATMSYCTLLQTFNE